MEVIVKRKKSRECQGRCERRSKGFVKIKRNIFFFIFFYFFFFFWGGGGGGGPVGGSGGGTGWM